MVYPASSRVTPLASRNLRSWEPRRIRSTVGPLPGCAVITSTPWGRPGDRRALPSRDLPTRCTCTARLHLHVHPALRLQGIEWMIALVPHGHTSHCAGDMDGTPITQDPASLANDNGGHLGV